MIYPVIYSREARTDILEHIIYLEKNRPGYGYKFDEALYHIEDLLSNHPDRYPAALEHPNFQCIRFPKPFDKSHSVFYKFDSEIVRIVCVFYNGRSPHIWRNRS